MKSASSANVLVPQKTIANNESKYNLVIERSQTKHDAN